MPPAGVQVTIPANPPPSPPMALDERQDIAALDEAMEGDAGVGEEAPVQEVEVVEAEEEFEEWELELLLDQGDDIEAIISDQEDDAWDAWAQAYPQHSARSWRTFWLEDAQPAYEKRKANQRLEGERKQKKKEGPMAVDGTHEHDAEDVRGSQPSAHETNSAMPMPSSFQKRKRTAYVEIPERTYGKKKRRSDNDEIVRREESEAESPPSKTKRAADQTFPTSEMSREADGQLRRKTLTSAKKAAEPTFPTSEMNREAAEQLEREARTNNEPVLPTDADAQAEAQAQFDEEVLGIARKSRKGFSLRAPSLPTSDVNRGADEQLRRESMDREGEDGNDEHMEEEDSVLRTPSIQSQDEVEDEDQAEGEGEIGEDEAENEPVRSQNGENAVENILEIPGDRLTEANLANQQAQHKAQLLRGADLPEDDDAQDGEQQTEFLRFLQGVTSPPDGVRAIPAITRELQDAVAVESQLPQTALPAAYTPFDPADTEELPLSSQKEIDQALDDMIEWPESLTAASKPPGAQVQSQSLRFETQVPYPTLPPQRRIASQQEEEEMFSSQTSMLPEVSYPSLSTFRELRSSQTAHSSARNPEWSRAEDLALLRGMKLEMSASQIIKKFDLERSESALRNRRKVLNQTFVEGRVPPGHEYYAEVERSPSPRRRVVQIDFDQAASSLSFGGQQQHDVNEDSSRESEEEVNASNHQAADHEDDIDLFVRPPEGGWTSSPPRDRSSSQATPMASQQQQHRGSRAPRFSQYSQPKSQGANARAMVEMSSTSSSSSSSSDESEAPARTAVPRRQVLETQDIMDAETQQPDFEMPLPPDSNDDQDNLPEDLTMPLPPNSDNGGDDDSLHSSDRSSSPAHANTTESQRALADAETLDFHKMEDFIETQLVRGFKLGPIIAALKCTSARKKWARFVLVHERAGMGFPKETPGVWSEEEDKLLEGGNAKAIRKLEEKHGWKECVERLEFLQDWREGNDDDEE